MSDAGSQYRLYAEHAVRAEWREGPALRGGAKRLCQWPSIRTTSHQIPASHGTNQGPAKRDLIELGRLVGEKDLGDRGLPPPYG